MIRRINFSTGTAEACFTKLQAGAQVITFGTPGSAYGKDEENWMIERLVWL